MQLGHLYLGAPERLEVVMEAIGLGVPDLSCLGAGAVAGDEDVEPGCESRPFEKLCRTSACG